MPIAIYEMSASPSVQRAHDELLRSMPPGASHDNCPMCHSAAGAIEQAKEGASVADPKYTEEQHLAILTAAVERETASLQGAQEELEARVEVLDTEKAEAVTALTEAQNKIDVLESEKAAETARADAAEKAFADFQADLDHQAAVEQAKTERAEAIKLADPTLDDEYFSAERVSRWAEMSAEQFTALVNDLTEAAAKRKPAAKDDDDEGKGKPPWQKAAVETAAFRGGEAPTSAGKPSGLAGLLMATGKLPASAASN